MIRIRVPATSANLGPGFDCLGVALGLYNRFDVELSEVMSLRGCQPRHAGADNLFLRACALGFETLGYPAPALDVAFVSDVPVARGLGSSATCIVPGLLAADTLSGGGLGRSRILDLAASMEGHPDNVVPALLGGFAVSILENGVVRTSRAPIGGELSFNAFVPDFELETATARAVLPDRLSRRDAVANTGRAALMTAAFLTRDWGLLNVACRDLLHEPYRAPLIPGFDAIAREARAAGALAVFLSGAGPTVMAVTEASDREFARTMEGYFASRRDASWKTLRLPADDTGATVESAESGSCPQD